MQPELTVENLKVTFDSDSGPLTAVNGISYTLGRGETLALVGESGCGKSVSALSILGLIPKPPGNIETGRILFDDRDLLKLPAKTLREIRGRDISMIFQDPMTSLNPVLTLGEQIMEPLLQHTSLARKDIFERAVELLTRVDIPSPREKMRQYAHQLSGGMRQRVMIAMALACSPRILIADEPTTALDVLIQAQIIDLLEELKQQSRMSMLLITHDLGIVTQIADRVLVMYAGEIVEAAPAADLFRSPLHPYTQGLKNSVPILGAERPASRLLPEIAGNVPSLDRLPAGCPFHPRCPSALPRCKNDKPLLKPVSPGRAASCFLTEESA